MVKIIEVVSSALSQNFKCHKHVFTLLSVKIYTFTVWSIELIVMMCAHRMHLIICLQSVSIPQESSISNVVKLHVFAFVIRFWNGMFSPILEKDGLEPYWTQGNFTLVKWYKDTLPVLSFQFLLARPQLVEECKLSHCTIITTLVIVEIRSSSR